jgi:hypothetical protein
VGCCRPERIEEPVRHRLLSSAVKYRPFLGFCCGKSRRSEYEVSLTIHNLYCDCLVTPQVAVILEKQTASDPLTRQRPLVGVSTIVRDRVPLGFSDVRGYAPSDPGAAIGVIGTDLAYRKVPLQDGKTRPGNALLEGTLKIIAARFSTDGVPFVKACVLPKNIGSLRLFDEHCFEDLGERGEGAERDQLTLFRHAGVPPSEKREPGWSLRYASEVGHQ